MRKHFASLAALLIIVTSLFGPIAGQAAAAEYKNLIYDEANLLSPDDMDALNAMANELGAEREIDIIIYTSDNSENKDVMIMTEDFYDERGPGYDKPFGNAVILTMDMRNREIYLAGFYKGEEYLDDRRLDKIRDKITPYLSDGDYRAAFEKYIETVHRYMGYEPGVNPDNILFQLWFQIAVALVIGGLTVGVMAYRSGGRVTVGHKTYEDAKTSGVMSTYDRFLRTTVTKRKIEKSSSSSGGGGGGRSSGGHSHSGSRGSF
ncbi:TPM domain-containing protein [Paenibacillus sp. M1]|uniref:TPM domain-containing protein n=1 Tax=Paenibacillus haidiansis TaxID=1574488 RepID=A0ABU7VXS5_9BACL